MNSPTELQQQLLSTRAFTERLLADFRYPAEWTFQVHPDCNHALWFVGHIGNTDNFFISLLAPDRAVRREGYQEKFGMGSHPTADPAEYPEVEEALEYMRERRATLLQLLAGMDEAALATPTPPKSPEFLPNFAAIFRSASWHEALHSGQLTVVLRALGRPPILQG